MNAMKKMWDMIKELGRILCVAVFFPGVEINFDAINHYFGTTDTNRPLGSLIGYCKRFVQDKYFRPFSNETETNRLSL